MVRVLIECSITVDVEQNRQAEDLVQYLETGKLAVVE